ncbi:hypothetical protein SETIT_1G194800v2 [Setaria italica]|uniref:Uncharacterized protein n=1 Tax=Setaria italica TaxID=4555 RepID=A0A368PMW1_SETIT|nr:hypothetical protein SETIT_1G194800v2 [Setaria italica]
MRAGDGNRRRGAEVQGGGLFALVAVVVFVQKRDGDGDGGYIGNERWLRRAPWTVRVRERALEAGGRCDHARGLLRGAVALLALPMHIADAPAGRARDELVIAALLDAGSGLAFAAAMTAVAELLALRGAAADPKCTRKNAMRAPTQRPPRAAAVGMHRLSRG